MIAMGIVMTVLSNMKLNRQGDDLSAATQLARAVLENTRSRTYANITVGTFDGTLSVPTPPNATTGFPPSPYPGTGKFKMRVVSTDFAPAARSVQVDVFWGARSNIRLFTLIHQ